MSKRKKLAFSIPLFCLLLIFVDQLTKYIISRSFPLYTGKFLIKDFLSVYHVRNTGSAFSFLADKTWGIYVLTAVSTALAVAVLFFLIKSIKICEPLSSVSLSLLFSGAAGNLIDRFRLHYVIDFIRFDFGSYTFPIFNVADICAVVGTVLLIVIIVFFPERAEKLW